jgi:hypothetical protein
MKKVFTFIVTLALLTSYLIIPEYTSAQSVTKPATPEFIVELSNKVIDEAPTYTTDPYSGETIIQKQGSHTSYWIVNIKIKNTDPNVYYNYRIKGYYTTIWAICPLIDNGEGVWTTREYSPFELSPHETFATSSSSEYTEVQVNMYGLESGNKIDVQVQSIAGTMAQASNGGYLILTGQGSDWSNTLTVTVPGASSLVSPSPTVPELPVFAILPLLFAVSLILLLLRIRNKQHTKQSKVQERLR